MKKLSQNKSLKKKLFMLGLTSCLSFSALANNFCTDLFYSTQFGVTSYDLPLLENLITNPTPNFKEIRWRKYQAGFDQFLGKHPQIPGLFIYYDNRSGGNEVEKFKIDLSYEYRDLRMMSRDLRFIFSKAYQDNFSEVQSVLVTQDENNHKHIKLELRLTNDLNQNHFLDLLIGYLKSAQQSYFSKPVLVKDLQNQKQALKWFSTKLGIQNQGDTDQGFEIHPADIFVFEK